MSSSAHSLQPDLAEGTLLLNSHAKINLFFRILARRPDGFHDIASLYHAIDLHDLITLELCDKSSLMCSYPDIPLDSSNLVLQAASFFDHPVKITIEKNIPIGAGLGGGSSNAAAVLWGMNHLLGKPFTHTQLLQKAAQIGSDTPFFLSNGHSYCTGRGEVLQNISPISLDSIWIKTPPLHCSTPKVYQACKPNEVSSSNPRELLRKAQQGEFQFINDLEPAAIRVYPELKKWLKEGCEAGFEQVMLTGSGASIIGYNPKSETAVEKMGYFKAKLVKTKYGLPYGRK